MSESIWQRESCGPGRHYMLGSDPFIKYEDKEAIISKIIEGLKKFIVTEPAVRLTLDTPLSNPERAILAIPFESDQEVLLANFAKVVYQSLMGYYISGDPKTAHFGIANLLIEGNLNSLLRREMEKLIEHFKNRYDMAGRLLENVKIVGKTQVPEAGNTFLSETIKKGLDIHAGYRVFIVGENINCAQVFLPLETGSEIIEQVYYNLERILHHSFVSFDESGDNYLKISETLIFKDLEAILQRSRTKEITRNKILNNLQFETVLKRDTEAEQVLIAHDNLYDLLNLIQDTKLKEVTDHSRELYAACMLESMNLLRADKLSAAALPKAEGETKAPEQREQQEMLADEAIQARTPRKTGRKIQPKTPRRPPLKRRHEKKIQRVGQEAEVKPRSEHRVSSPLKDFIRANAYEPTDGASTRSPSRRRRFQKVILTNEERAQGGVQVPSPAKEARRVPSPRPRIRKVQRVGAKTEA